MIEKIRQWIAGTGISEKALALIMAIVSFLVLNIVLFFEYRIDLFWIRLLRFATIYSVAISAGKERTGKNQNQLPNFSLLGMLLLLLIPIVNAYPSLLAGRNWAKRIMENHG
jgi:hypothetical protein